ncbi:MAG TPA: hypothetical protein VFZ61_03130, partial [Polyangiales bacterium]
SACASDSDLEPEPEPPSVDASDSAAAAQPDAGAVADSSTPILDAGPTPTTEAGADTGAPADVRDAALDAGTLPDSGPSLLPDAAADAGPTSDAQTDAGGVSSVCKGGKVESDSAKLGANSMYGSVEFWLPPSNAITRFQSTMFVPEEPSMRGTLFLWPGLQPLRGPDPGRVGNGVLQPVLTWGSSCAPKKPASYNEWWISGMYVNVTTSAAGPTGCAGGDAMNVAVGDDLAMDIRLDGTMWTQTVVNGQNGKSVNFVWDLKGQAQNRAIWDIEEVSSTKPTEDILFVDSVLSFARPATTCQPSQRGPTDYFSAPVLSPDGLHCCYGKIILRSRGVAATSPDQP